MSKPDFSGAGMILFIILLALAAAPVLLFDWLCDLAGRIKQGWA